MITIKTDSEIKIMSEGGAKLSRVKNKLYEAIAPGVSAMDIEELAVKTILEEGAKESFKMVPGYSWATCICVNEELVHGIPKKDKIFKKGDVVSVDVGIFYKGFHTDTSFSLAIDGTKEVNRFLNVGRNALEKALGQVKVGNHIFDISAAIQNTIEESGYSTIKSLVGHGVGRELHEDPQIPCFVPAPNGRKQAIKESPEIKPGMVLAVEVMYAQGGDKVEVLSDGWTIAMRDGKISGLFEETVAVTREGRFVLTRQV